MEHQRESSMPGTVTATMEADERPLETPASDDESHPTNGVPVVDRFPEDTLIPEPIDRRFPLPPERGSLDDEHLVPLVGRHTDDTATIDLIGILQAQMQLRAAEAARFAAWEAEIRRIGTDEALEELEKTRLHFTGVIPIQTGPGLISVDRTPPPSSPPVLSAPPASSPAEKAETAEKTGPSPAGLITVDQTPTGEGLVPQRVIKTAAEPPVVTTGSIPVASDGAVNPHVERARVADEVLLERGTPSSPGLPGDEAGATAPASRRILVVAVSVLAALLVIVAVLLSGIGAPAVASAVFGAIAVPAAAWLGVVIGHAALRARSLKGSARTGGSARIGRPDDMGRPARTPLARAAGLIVGTAVGEGLIQTSAPAFAWQGYLLSLVHVSGVPNELSVVIGLVAALALAFVIVVVGGGRTRTASAGA